MFVKLFDGRFINLSHVVSIPVIEMDEGEVYLKMSGGDCHRVSLADALEIRNALDRNPNVIDLSRPFLDETYGVTRG